MDHEAGAEFGLEPSGLRRHDIAGIGYVHELLHRNGIESQGHGHLARVNATLQLFEAADAAYEVDALVGAEIGDAEDVAQDKVRRDCYIEHTDRVIVVICAFAGSQRIPAAFEITSVNTAPWKCPAW